MSRIHVHIDRLVLNGFAPLEAKALTEALELHLSQALSVPPSRTAQPHSHRTPVLRLGRMPLEAGAAGAAKLGRQVARAVARGLKP